MQSSGLSLYLTTSLAMLWLKLNGVRVFFHYEEGLGSSHEIEP